jgi:hypothetical protein
MSNHMLTPLMYRVPANCILLLGNLDAAFLRSTMQDKPDMGKPHDGQHC